MGAELPEQVRVRAIKAPHRPREIRTVTSVERGRPPSPGVYVPPYFWRDVLDSPPPRRLKRGQGSYVVYHALDVDTDARLAYSTVISVDPGKDLDDTREDFVRVDSRVSVQRRLFLELISRERAFMNRFTSRWHEFLVRSLVSQRRVVRRLPTQWMRKTGLGLVRAQGRAGRWTINAVQATSNAIVQFPDDVYTKAMRAWSVLYGRVGRQGLWQGMKDPRSLSTEEKSVVMFLSTTLLLGTIFLLNNLMLFFSRSLPGVGAELAGAFLLGYIALVKAFLWGVATAVALPFPPSEAIAAQAFRQTGPLLAFSTMVLSKVVGAWLVFFIGDSLNKTIQENVQGKPRMERMVEWMNRNSLKYGFWILALFTAAPFLPDTLALYVFAVSGVTFRQYMLGCLIGTSVRYAGVIGILVFAGEGRLNELLGLG